MAEISVIIPTLNEEKNIEKCINSVREQESRSEIEIIVCDGASIDKTAKISERLADRVVISKKRCVAYQRNLGASYATGDILIFLDADTYMKPGYIASIEQYFKKNIIAATSDFELSPHTVVNNIYSILASKWLYLRALLKTPTLPGFNTVIRSDIFWRVGGYKDIVLEDVQLSRDIVSYGEVGYIPLKGVVTSDRRIRHMGLIETCRYYTELDLRRKGVSLPGLMKYSHYIHYFD